MTVFTIWFVHFLLCWTAVEIWPNEWRANQLAGWFTAIALLVIGLHSLHLHRMAGRGELARPAQRMARAATVIATVAVLFTALPAAVIRP